MGLDQKTLAEKVGVGPSYISQLISNPGKAPSVTVFLRLAAAFDLDNPNDLFQRPPAGDLSGAEWAAIAQMRKPKK